MLTKNSYIALDMFSKSVSRNKYPLLDTLCSFFETIDIDYEITSSQEITKRVSYQRLQNEKFIDDHLKQQITLLSNYKRVTVQSNQYTFHLEFYYQTNDKLDLLIDSLTYALCFTTQLAPHRVKEITIKYYLLDSKRVFDNDTYFDKEEVNGGACWSSSTECDITVWRKEEILKVTIHELIHGLSYDYKKDTSDIIQHYQTKYGITSPKMNTFEAYTEIFAELIHCYLLTRFIHVLYPSVQQCDLFSFMVSIEHQFSQMQASKVLELLQHDQDVNKETNVTAYYLIKTELYNDLSNFLKFCFQYNDTIIKIKDTTKYFDYLKKLKSVVKKKYKTKNQYLKNTTRMTCLELDLF
jgi:hypothetical protein